jgi:hypothetical protein
LKELQDCFCTRIAVVLLLISYRHAPHSVAWFASMKNLTYLAIREFKVPSWVDVSWIQSLTSLRCLILGGVEGQSNQPWWRQQLQQQKKC